MKALFLVVPGRFPTVSPEAAPWWDRLGDLNQVDCQRGSLNHAWWSLLCSQACVGAFSKALGHGRIDDFFGPSGSLLASSAEAGRALSAFTQPQTYAEAGTYVQTVSALLQHLANLNSMDGGLKITLDDGPECETVNYADSASIASFAGLTSTLAATIEASLHAMQISADFIGFKVNSAFELLSAAIASQLIRRNSPATHTCLVDHAYENFSLDIHLSRLKKTGALLECFDSMIESKDDIAVVLPTLLAGLSQGTAERGWLTRPPAPLSVDSSRSSRSSSSVLPAFTLETIAHFRLSAKRCYWSRCTYCTQNSKHTDTAAPGKTDALEAVERLERLIKDGVSNVIFSDEAVSPAMLRHLSLEILRRGLRLRWACRCKLERSFNGELFGLAARAGCYEILWGLETIAPELLVKMDKQVERFGTGQIAKTFQAQIEAGIGIHINLISGFPGETLEQAEASAEFVLQILGEAANATFSLNRFSVFPATPISETPQRFGIELMAAKGDMPSSYAYRMPRSTAMRTQAVLDRYHELEQHLFEGLGWTALRDSEEGRAALNLYAGSGHCAVFKTMPSNTMDRLRKASPAMQRCSG